MTKKPFRAVLAPMYLQLYDDVVPSLRGELMPMVKQISGMLEGMAEIRNLPVITTREDAEKLRQACSGDDIDAVILLHLAYSPSLLVANVLKDLRKPLLLIDTTFDCGFGQIDGAYLLKNHAIHGVMDLAAVLRSKGVQYRICAGYYRDAGFASTLSNEIRILRASAQFLKQNIGITGKPFDMMGDFAVDNAYLEQKFGHRIVEIDEERILDVMSHIPDGQVDEEYAKETAKYSFIGDSISLKRNIREHCALRSLFEAHNISAYTMNFNVFNKVPVPFYAINRMLSDGLGYAGEGDLITASLGKPLNLLSNKAAFTEFFCPDWDNNLLLMSHMGEADPRFAKENFSVVLAEKVALGKSLPSYYYQFEAQPMEMTFATWRQNPGGGAGLLVGVLDCVEHTLYEVMGVPQFVVSPRQGIREFLMLYSMEGGGHHLYVAEGNILDSLSAFCGVIGVDIGVI